MPSRRGGKGVGLDAGVGRLLFWDPSCAVGFPSSSSGQCDAILALTEVQQGERRRVS